MQHKYQETAKETTLVGTGGILGTYGIGLVSNQCVPIAMKTFGIVTKGVGTYHQAGGIAATLQQIATFCTSGTTVATAGMVGVGIYYTTKYTYNGIKYVVHDVSPFLTSKL
jgi:hypothetical protein